MDSTPPKRYTHKTETVSFRLLGDDGETPESRINGARFTTVDPVTGIQTIEDHQHKDNDNMDGLVTPQSFTVALGVTEVSSYDDEPNQQGDGAATKTLKIVLKGENTTAMLIQNVISELPSYPEEYADGSPQAYRNLLGDDLGFDYQKVSYRFVWNDGVEPENRHAVKTLLIFEPEDDPATTENESVVDKEVVRIVEWDGLDAGPYEIDPETEKPGKDGRYFLLPVDLEIKRGGLGTNLPPPALPQAPVLPTWQSQGGKIRDLVSVWDAHTSSAQVADLKGDWMQARVRVGGLTAADLPPNFVIWLIDGHPAPAPNTLETPRFSWPGNFGEKKVQVTIGGEIFKVYVHVPNVGALDHVGWGAVMALVHGPVDALVGAAFAKSYDTSETAWSGAYVGKPSVRNALRHSSWIAHCASQDLINPVMAELLGTAHEYDNFSSGNNWAYESTMDLHNNTIGATCIHSNFLGFPETAAIRNDVTAKLVAGELWIWDSAGLEHTGFKATMKSNDLPINP